MTAPAEPRQRAAWDAETAIVRRADGTSWHGLGYCCDVEHRLRYPMGDDGTTDGLRRMALAGATYCSQFRSLVMMPERRRNAVIRDLRRHYEDHPWNE
jgi:hypothetical protein